MRGLLAALSFLTRIPVPPRWIGEEMIQPAAMIWWFVPVGVIIGALAAGVTWLSALLLPWISAAAVGVVALVALSGGLHLEGLMDTWDGVGSNRPRERALEIMKDSRVGAFGVMGAVCLLMVKFALLAGMEPRAGLAAVFLSPVTARLMQVTVLRFAGYARPEGGLGQAFFAAATPAHVALGLGVAAASTAFAWAVGFGITAPAAMLGGLVVSGLFAHVVGRRLGGHTGDTVGATSEMAELSVMASCAVLVSMSAGA